MHVGGFPRRFQAILQAILGSTGPVGASRGQGPPGASRGLQGPPEASRGAPGASGKPPKKTHKRVLNEKCARRVPAKPRTLGEAEISRGMVRLDEATHHGGGGGLRSGQGWACLQRGVEGVFKGI